MQLLHLLLRDLDLLEPGRDLLVREVAALPSLGDEDRSSSTSLKGASPQSARERNVFLCAQPTLLRCVFRRPARRPSSTPRNSYVNYERGIDRDGLSQSYPAPQGRSGASSLSATIPSDCADCHQSAAAMLASSVMTEPLAALEDVQARRPTTHVSLSRVGVTGVEKIVRIQANGDEQLFYAQLECFVDLGPEAEGRAHVALRGDRERGDRGGRPGRGRSRPRRSRPTSPSECASARAPGAPRSRSRRATPSTSRRPSRACRPRSSTRCSARRWRRSPARDGWSACRRRA